MQLNIRNVWAMVVVIGAALGTASCMTNSSDKMINDSRSFYESGNFRAATELLKGALDNDPERADAQLLLIDIYLKRGQIALATAQVETALAEIPSKDDFLIAVSNSFIKHEQPHAALALLSSASVAERLEATRLALMAQCYAQMRSLETSEQFFKDALDLEPGLGIARLGIAQLLLLSGRQDEGREFIAEFIHHNPTHTGPYYIQLRLDLARNDAAAAVEVLNQIRSIDPQDINATYLLGLIHLSNNSLKEARRVVREIKSVTRDDPVAERLESLIYLNEGEYKIAAQGLERSLKSLPDLPGYVYAGAAYIKLRDYTKAYGLLRQALTIDGVDEQANVLMAFCLYKMRKYADGLVIANRALSVHPRNAMLHNIVGAINIEVGDFDLANHHMKTAATLDSTSARTFSNLREAQSISNGTMVENVGSVRFDLELDPVQPRILIALDNIDSGNYELAIKNIEGWLQYESTRPLFNYLLAQAYKGLGDNEQEWIYLKLSVNSKKDFIAPRLVMAKRLIESERFAEAEYEYKDVIKIAPGNVLAYLSLAGLYEMFGKIKEADDVYKLISLENNITALMARSGFLFRSDRKDEALELLLSGYKNNKDNPYLLKSLGEALSVAERNDEAVEVFLELDRIHPGSALPLIVSSHLGRGDVAAAEKLVSQVFSETQCSELVYLLKANVEEARMNLAQAEKILMDGIDNCRQVESIKLKYGEVLYKQGKYDAAMRVYDDLIAENPVNTKAIFLKGVVNSLAGNAKQAIEYYRNALEINKNYAPALNNLAFLRCKVDKECEAALGLATKAFNLLPDNHEVSSTLGYIYIQNGQPEKAISFIRKALSLSPDSDEYNRLLQTALVATDV